MTIPSIKMTDSSAAEATTAGGSTGASDVSVSFASLLGVSGDEGAAVGPSLPTAGPGLHGMTAQGETEPEIAKGGTVSLQSVTPSTVETVASATTAPGLPGGGMPSRQTQADGAGLEVHSPGIAKAKTDPVKEKVARQRQPVDGLAVAPGMVESQPPVAANGLVVDRRVVISSTQVSPSQVSGVHTGSRALYIDGGQTEERGAVAGADEGVADAAQGVLVHREDDRVSGAAAGAIVDSGVGSQERVAVAVPESSQASEALSSAAGLMQNAQAESLDGDDSVQPMQLQMAANLLTQKKTHALPNAADKSSIPAGPTAATIGPPLVLDTSQGTANQRPFDALNWSYGERDLSNANRGAELTTPDLVNMNGGVERGINRQSSDATHTSSSIHQQIGTTGLTDASAFGMTFSRELGGSNTGGSPSKDIASTATTSSSEQFAMERMQTAGATRALGDALQSTMGLGVQTETFGRVTIHTATEGNHLMAQVTLEDGRQSAALVSHIPAVEQKLSQRSGLEASVNVSTGSQSSTGGSQFGDSGREASQRRRSMAEPKVLRAGLDAVSAPQAGEDRVPSPWHRGTNVGRLDVTV